MDGYTLHQTEYFCRALFENPNYISAASLKALQQGGFEHLIEAYEVQWNGRDALIYLQENRSRLAESLPLLSNDQILEIMIQLIDIALNLKQSLLLNPKGLLFESRYIWLNTNTLDCSMIFVPLALPMLHPESLEDTIKKAFVQYLEQASSALLYQFEPFVQADGLLDMRRVLASLKENPSYVSPGLDVVGFVLEDMEDGTRRHESTQRMTLVGRSEQADLRLADSMKIGRKHCRIERGQDGRSFTIEDLSSANGTYVNGIRLQPGLKSEIRFDDVLTLADKSYRFTRRPA